MADSKKKDKAPQKPPTPAPAKDEKVAATAASSASTQKIDIPTKVVTHPLVLLSVVDHYTRSCQDTGKRAVGILLGESYQGRVDITNSYAVPFDEDTKDPTIWFLDSAYHEEMFGMFKKVNAREKVVGWYSTGPKIRPADIDINELIRKYTPNPLLCIVDVNPKDDLDIPTEAYISVENTPEDQSASRRTFLHLPSEVGAYEAEEVGVEHLLRNIRDTSVSTIADHVSAKLASLRGLKRRMEEIAEYLTNVIDGKMAINHQIIYNLQDIINLSPDLKVEELVKAFSIKTNDNMLMIYMSSLVRSIIALHNLINNKLENRQLELEKQKPPAPAADKNKEQDKEKEKGKEKEKEKDSSKKA